MEVTASEVKRVMEEIKEKEWKMAVVGGVKPEPPLEGFNVVAI